MARPQKNGLDYFALDVVMSDEVEVIEATYGLEGFAILIKLYQKIYSESYFLEWNEKQQILFSNRVSTDRNKVTSIVNDCIEWDIFDKEKYTKYNILTSRRIQNHYFVSVYKRVNVEAIKEYLLIDVADKENLNVIHISNADCNGVSDDGNEDTSVVTDDESTQSKEDKSKEKETTTVLQIKNLRVRYSSDELAVIDNYLDILRWTRQKGKIADSVIISIYKEWEKHSISKVMYGLNVYIKNPKYHDKKRKLLLWDNQKCNS